ncbi:hypothetical protein CAPTEDRAFT_227316 [Capitella teleta]|uniref:Cystatin domain-containing protein n=1 Tax=Capitella teleta TaxID=283909 RepID=R7V0L4_CAPTE|nr:hypothetical protein CAPTEDRAFT_227316 [Capitella teleta]|eukprot:ELU12383.1 hypothetical protein CAPTEDRAFT_227316 [Capitella teleta]
MASTLRTQLLSLACLVATVALVNGSCIGTIKGFMKEGKHLIGGWRPLQMNDASTVEKLEALAQISATLYNEMSNDLRVYEAKPLEEGAPLVQEAYTQLVNGINYCLRFTMKSLACKNSGNCETKSMQCDSQVYTQFSWDPKANDLESTPDVSVPIDCTPISGSSAKSAKSENSIGQNMVN